MCRLRLGLRGGGQIIRASHPGTLSSRDTLPGPSAVVVGWNGYDTSVGPWREWPVEVPPACESPAQPSGVGTDLLLAVPRDGRSGLVLTLRVVVAGKGGAADAEADAAETLGIVSIGWDGLSCLPVSGTEYLVETPSRNSLARPATVDLELLADVPLPSSPAAAGGARCTSIRGVESAPASPRAPATGGGIRPCHQGGRRTAGLYLRVNLQLETSPVSVPHALSLWPIAARGPTAGVSGIPGAATEKGATGSLSAGATTAVSLGDFRNPCRKQRVPYLHFSWPWDDYWSALTERRSSPIAQRPWQHGSRGAVSWARKGKTASGSNIDEGNVSVRLPQRLSGLDGSVARPSSQEPRNMDIGEDFLSGGEVYPLGARAQRRHPPPPALFVEAYDMGAYAPLEHRAAMVVQRVWRRALSALRGAREWGDYYATVDRYNAAVFVQAHYRGWRGRQRARVIKLEAAVRGAAAAVIQRRWR